MGGDETFLLKKKRKRDSWMETHSRINEKVILKERYLGPPFFFEGATTKVVLESRFISTLLLLLLLLLIRVIIHSVSRPGFNY